MPTTNYSSNFTFMDFYTTSPYVLHCVHGGMSNVVPSRAKLKLSL